MGCRRLAQQKRSPVGSSEDGTVPTITGELIAGHAYVLTETKAPDGYALITESLHFTVGRKGRAASVTAGTELPDGYTIGVGARCGIAYRPDGCPITCECCALGVTGAPVCRRGVPDGLA